MARYEINDNPLAVEVFVDGQELPVLHQPHWPDGEVWANPEEAEAWGAKYVAALDDEAAPFPPLSRGGEDQSKPEVTTADEPAPAE